MTIPFSICNVTSQIPIISVGDLSVSNITVTDNMVLTTGGFTIHTVIGFIDYSSGSLPNINCFVNSHGKPLEIPKDSRIIQTILTTQGQPISPNYGSFLRVFIRPDSESSSIQLYSSIANSSLITGKILENSNVTDILDKPHRVYTETSTKITSGTLRIIIQYQIPI